MTIPVLLHRRSSSDGFTVLEVVVAIFIFGVISASLFRLIMHTDRIRGRALYLSSCSRLAASEAERLRSIAAENAPVEDSIYTTSAGKRTFTVKRNVIEPETPPDFIARAREPIAVEIVVSEESLTPQFEPLHFKLLIGQERP